MATQPVFARSLAISPSSILPRIPTRAFSISSQLCAATVIKKKEKAAKEKLRKRRKRHTMYKMPDMKDMKQFTLCDAMQYIKAFEVGRSILGPKYDIAIRLRTKKDGPVVRNQIRLPYSVKTDIKVCVICPPGSKQAQAAIDAGALLVGEEEVFDIVKNGKIDFDRCIAAPSSMPKIAKEGLPRILGPRGLMPSTRLGTVTDKVGEAVTNLLGGSTYRERQGVVRMAVGKMGFTPEMLRDNVKAFVGQVKKEGNSITDKTGFTKEVFEVVLSSTNSPGFSLNGVFRDDTSPSLGTQLAP